jgi:vancomycin permeability regulator SanA
MAVVLSAIVLTAEVRVRGAGAGRVVRVVDAPARDVALVLGAPPGRLLDQRMDAACALVARGVVQRLLLSGMPAEMPTMRARARACLPEDRITVDDGAARTLASFMRARARWGVEGGLVVSQAYHLPRALFLADAVGFDAIGVIAAGEPSARGWARERGATLRAWLDAWRARPRP